MQKPNMFNHIPTSIENCLSNLSSTAILFKELTKYYEDNLQQSGYNKKLTYKPTVTIKNIGSIGEKLFGLTYRSEKMFL